MDAGKQLPGSTGVGSGYPRAGTGPSQANEPLTQQVRSAPELDSRDLNSDGIVDSRERGSRDQVLLSPESSTPPTAARNPDATRPTTRNDAATTQVPGSPTATSTRTNRLDPIDKNQNGIVERWERESFQKEQMDSSIKAPLNELLGSRG